MAACRRGGCPNRRAEVKYKQVPENRRLPDFDTAFLRVDKCAVSNTRGSLEEPEAVIFKLYLRAFGAERFECLGVAVLLPSFIISCSTRGSKIPLPHRTPIFS